LDEHAAVAAYREYVSYRPDTSGKICGAKDLTEKMGRIEVDVFSTRLMQQFEKCEPLVSRSL